MLKIKTKNFRFSVLLASLFILFSIYNFFPKVSADVCPPDRQACASQPAGGSTTCDPKADWWCKGACDLTSSSNAAIANDPLKVRSCKCDGTPNLNQDQVTSCEACSNAANAPSSCISKNPIVTRIQQIVNFLSGLVAIVITGVIIVGGIEYSMARDKPDAAAKARWRIFHAIVALVVYLFIFAFLQWLIPGGIFRHGP